MIGQLRIEDLGGFYGKDYSPEYEATPQSEFDSGNQVPNEVSLIIDPLDEHALHIPRGKTAQMDFAHQPSCYVRAIL